MTRFSGPPAGATRNKPITDALKDILDSAARVAGIDAIHITSGGQDALGQGNRRTGSTRHDRGRAADIQCQAGGRTLTFNNQSADPIILAFITAAAAAGATGIGAATDYMGDRTIHVGFGTSVADQSRLTWGRDGRTANAPNWLRQAAAAGWANPTGIHPVTAQLATLPGRYKVIARSGLRLRGGPGSNFAVEMVLPLDTELDLLALDQADPNWGRVDLQGDGLLDGYVHLGFLARITMPHGNEHAAEPDDTDHP